MVKNAEIAWLAGIIDGEGSMGRYKRGNSFFYDFKVVNTNMLLLEKTKSIIEKIIGRPIRLYEENHANSTKQAYRIILTRQGDMAKVIEKILPYLTAKANIAEMLWEEISCLLFWHEDNHAANIRKRKYKENAEPARKIAKGFLGVCDGQR